MIVLDSKVAVKLLVDLIEQAFALSLASAHAVYDCMYLALAVRLDTVALTHDEGFAAAAERIGLGAHIELLT